jgi:hypothetical protein
LPLREVRDEEAADSNPVVAKTNGADNADFESTSLPRHLPFSLISGRSPEAE